MSKVSALRLGFSDSFIYLQTALTHWEKCSAVSIDPLAKSDFCLSWFGVSNMFDLTAVQATPVLSNALAAPFLSWPLEMTDKGYPNLSSLRIITLTCNFWILLQKLHNCGDESWMKNTEDTLSSRILFCTRIDSRCVQRSSSSNSINCAVFSSASIIRVQICIFLFRA